MADVKNILKQFLKIGNGIAISIVPAIAAVEVAVTNLKAGKDKKDNVLDIVKNTPAIVEAIKGGDIVDEVMFGQAIDEINDGYVKLMNSLKKTATPTDVKVN